MAVLGANTIIIITSVAAALIYSGQVSVVIQKLNEVLHWKLGCNPIHSVGNVSLHYFYGRGKAEAIRLLLEDQKIPYTEKDLRFTEETWPSAKKIGIESGLYVFGQVPAMETNKGKRLVQSVVILHYLGRSVGLDCDCRDIEKCDMIAAGVEDLSRRKSKVLYDPDYTMKMRDEYITNVLSTWLNYFENLAPNHDADAEGLYFASGRLTWLDYLVYEMLESNCDLMNYKDGHQSIGIKKQPNCTETFHIFPRLNAFYNYFKERTNIREYNNSGSRPKFALRI